MTRTECEKLITETLKMLHTMIKDYTGDRLVSMTISSSHVSFYAFDDDMKYYILDKAAWYDGTESGGDEEEKTDE